ncbi:hypothetical protein [Gallibacterium anatis]|uniref:hypothetical protein n=1 Tax=Gallibacterium anatis TaxID=750 RepID=UPI0039FD016A
MNTLTNYFQERLVEAGFPADLKLEWSLNYRQDKGHVAFYGDISYQDLFNLFNYVYPNKKYKHQRLERLIRSIFGMEGHNQHCKNFLLFERNGSQYTLFERFSMERFCS